MKIITKCFVFSILCCSTIFAFAQENNNSTFSVVLNSKITNIESYVKAVELANFNCYHFKNTRRKITFDTGVEIELFSIDEMLRKGLKVDKTCLVNEEKLEKKPPVYHLSETGIIMELHDDNSSHQK